MLPSPSFESYRLDAVVDYRSAGAAARFDDGVRNNYRPLANAETKALANQCSDLGTEHLQPQPQPPSFLPAGLFRVVGLTRQVSYLAVLQPARPVLGPII